MKKITPEVAADINDFIDTYAEDLRELLRNQGATYPMRTLKRRLGFLTATERKRVISKFNRLTDLIVEIDLLISDRAVIVNDKWP